MQETSCPKKLSDHIAQLALTHYEATLPEKGKPKTGGLEWTVFAAIVATTTSDISEDSWVVSSATGTKCCAIPMRCKSDISSLCILRDSHAEVLARRGLNRILSNEIRSMLEQQVVDPKSYNRRLLQKTKDAAPTSTTFQLRSDVSLHLFVSDSPCGDASIYTLKTNIPGCSSESETTSSVEDKSSSVSRSQRQQVQQFTGSKIIVSEKSRVSLEDCGEVVWSNITSHLAREPDDQLLGKVRSKAGRSNLPEHLRSRSMSCSDKLVRWSVLGLQGSLLMKYIPQPIRLEMIVLGRDDRSGREADGKSSQLAAANRIADRVLAVQAHLETAQSDKSCPKEYFPYCKAISAPKMHVTDLVFPCGKSSTTNQDAREPVAGDKRKQPPTTKAAKTASPAGMSINWQSTLSDPSPVELTIGARGIRQGKKPRSSIDYNKLQSRLSRKSLLDLMFPNENGPRLPQTTQEYKEFKEQQQKASPFTIYTVVRHKVLCEGPLAGWLLGDSDIETTPTVSDSGTVAAGSVVMSSTNGVTPTEERNDHARFDKCERLPAS